MSFDIRFSPEAEETYDAVISQLQAGWGDQFVSKFETKWLSCLQKISQKPFYLWCFRRKFANQAMCFALKLFIAL